MEHIRIHRQCGACGFLFSLGSPLIALVASPTGCVALSASKFSAAGEPHIRDSRIFCRHLHCKRCSAAEETATIHVDCFKLYNVRTKDWPDRLRRLWIFSLARYPWPRSPALLLPSVPSLTVIDLANSHAGTAFNLQKLIGLSQDIVTMIWGYLSQHALLRLSCVLETINFLNDVNYCTILSVPLGKVHSWCRGNDPIMSTTGPLSSIELTVDSRGIKSIHRSGCSARKSQSPFNIYITIGITHNITIEFQCGVSRLAPTSQSADLQITDLPNLSPSLGFQFPAPKHSVRLAATNLDRCSGITFFLSTRDLRAIHAHTHATPIADTTFAQIDPAVQRSISWFYVPNPPTDKISAFGVRILTKNENELQLKRRSYLVRTPHRGDFYIGPAPVGSGKTFAVHTPPQSTLLSSVADNNFTLIRGVLTEGSLCSAAVPPAPENPLLSDACYSSAQLKDIMSIWIFRDEKDHFCRGLIFEYFDGTERALGCCRIGVDTAERCPAVERFCFKAAQRIGLSIDRTVMVRDRQVSEDRGDDDAGWTRCSEGDILEVWATVTEMVMTTTKIVDRKLLA